ncbi:hypothetical protein ADL26_14970 [Thermoactinomyces vulgaris]|nr:hypothetical protein ADL26_14970 [Thermoactinomyces vulgaris]
MEKTTDDMYTWTFTAEEAEVIKFALDQTYKQLKDHRDEWHQQQCQRIKQILLNRFEAEL